MKVIMLMAMSLDGVTAKPDGSESFLSHAGGRLISELTMKTGALIWGRKTDQNFQEHYSDADKQLLAGIPKVVISGSNYQPADGYQVVNTPAEAIALLESQGISAAALVGGSTLNAAFLKANLIDEIMVIIEPVLAAEGLPLIKPVKQRRLKLLSQQVVNNGEVLLHYQVVKAKKA